MFGIERIERRARGITLLAALGLTLTAATPAKAQHLVNFGDTIDEPGVYFLNGDQHGSGVGLVITADDVALFMFRFTLRNDVGAPPAVGPVGIVMAGCDNANLFGGRVTGFTLGLSMGQCTNCTIKDTRFDHNEVGGIEMSLVSKSAFVRVHTDHNGSNGIAGYDCSDNRFLSVRSDENDEDGLLLRGEVFGLVEAGFRSSGNTVKKCWFAYNGANGLELRDADDNTVEENQSVANEYCGILLSSSDTIEWLGGGPPPPVDGSDGNRVAKNWCPANGDGIAVDDGCTDNHLVQNIALASFGFDAFDDNDAPPCANTWFLNTVLTRGGAGAICIF